MEVKEVSTELLEVLKNGIISGSEMIRQQFPILTEQIIRWGIVNNILTIILSIVICGISIPLIKYLLKCSIKQCEDNNEPEHALLFIGIIIVGVISIIFFVYFWISLFEIFKVVSAPNIYILEYFKSLVVSK